MISMKRNRLEIMRDILKVSDSERGAKKSWIIRRASMSFDQVKYYIPLLVERNFLNEKNNGGGDIRYVTSRKGREFVRYAENINI